MGKMTPEQEQDEFILASILAAGETVARLRPGSFVSSWDATKTETCKYPSCAVGAGLLYRGLSAKEIYLSGNPPRAFADKYGVSWSYACGVSDGFEETYREDRNGITVDCFDDDGTFNDTDYYRGVTVGATVLEATSL